MVLHCEYDGADEITVELVGGTGGPVTLDEDGIIILRVTSTSQSVKVTASAGGHSLAEKTYALTGLTLKQGGD